MFSKLRIPDGGGTDFITFAAGTTTVTGNILPEAVSSRDLGSTTLQWDELYLGDNNGIKLGLDADAVLAYDETTDDRVELSGTNASLFLEDRLSLGVQTITLTDDGASNDTLTPTSSYVRVTVDGTGDGGHPALSISESSAKDGDMLVIINGHTSGATGNEKFTLAHSDQVLVLPQGIVTLTLEKQDVIVLMYVNDRWVTISRTDNTTPSS